MRFNMERTWGLEIEFKGNARAVIREMQARGLECRNSGYTHQVLNTWKMVSDSSCEWELVSPPLAGAEGFRQLEIACAALNAAGAQVDRSCGLHVHHIARDLPTIAIRRFLKLYCRYEGVIDTLLAPSRRNNSNTYCRSLRSRLTSDYDYNNLDHATNLYAFNGTRYMKVNLESMESYGTVEVRHHQGTTDFEKIKSWVVFTQALLNHAVDSRVSNSCKATWEQLTIIIGAVGKMFKDDVSRDAIAYLGRKRREMMRGTDITSRTVIEPMQAPMTVALERRPRRRSTRAGRQRTSAARPTSLAEESSNHPFDGYVCATCGFIYRACMCDVAESEGTYIPRGFDPVAEPRQYANQEAILEAVAMGPSNFSCGCPGCRRQLRAEIVRASD